MGPSVEGMQLAYLDETQNAQFDAEYHSAAEMAAKIALLRAEYPRELEILDLGGGNGVFLDQLLEALPHARGVVLDISPGLLAANRPHPRKELLQGSIEHLAELAAGRRFDVVTINWVLHHMVGRTEAGTRRNVELTLRAARAVLKPGGSIFAAETMVQGPFGTDLPGRLIYEVTRQTHPFIVRLARRVANTAGVGVRFRSARGWMRRFAAAGLFPVERIDGPFWSWSWRRRALHLGVGLLSQRHRHFLLRPAPAPLAAALAPVPTYSAGELASL